MERSEANDKIKQKSLKKANESKEENINLSNMKKTFNIKF